MPHAGGDEAPDDRRPVADHQQRRLIDEHERHDEAGRADLHRRPAAAPEIGLGQPRRGVDRERDRRRDRRQDGEVEGKHMRRRHHHAELDQRRHQKRGHDDIGRRRRHAHAEHDAGDRMVSKSASSSVVLRQADHRLREDDACARQRDDADDYAGAGASERDRERIAGAVDRSRAMMMGHALTFSARRGPQGRDREAEQRPASAASGAL
jgi:hypothetical protein